ncbi:MAG: hypothetical protein PVI06_16670, partial [Desulfobacterales bacterium]
RWQAGRVFKAPATSFRLIKNVLDKVKKDLGNSPIGSGHFRAIGAVILHLDAKNLPPACAPWAIGVLF